MKFRVYKKALENFGFLMLFYDLRVVFLFRNYKNSEFGM